MKLFSLFFLIFYITAIIILHAGDPKKIDVLESAYQEILKESKNLINKTKSRLTVEQSMTVAGLLSKSLAQSKVFLGDKKDIFISSKEETQRKFINALWQSGEALIEAAANQAKFNLYGNSAVLLDSQNIPYTIFLDIAKYIEEEDDINRILQKYIPGKGPILAFQTMYRVLVYDWLIFYTCNIAQNKEQLPSLAKVIKEYEFLISNQDEILMSALKNEHQILAQLLNQETLLKQKDKLNDYLALVRNYMRIAFHQSPIMQLVIEDLEKNKDNIRRNLEKLSEASAFKALNMNNPLVIRVEKELSELQPEPAIPQVLLTNLTTLSIQLIQLRTSIIR